jgi:DNA-binding transcriptional MerR regulator
MSGDEQDVAILRVVKQRGEFKKKRTLLQSELRAAGQSLSEIGDILKRFDTSTSLANSIDFLIPQIDRAPDICGLSRIRTMLQELKEVEQTLADLSRTATELGID